MRTRIFRALVSKELLSNLAGFRFVAIWLLTVVLVILGTHLAADHYDQRLAEYRDRLEHNERQLLDTHVYSFLQPAVFQAPDPLGVLDQGYSGRLRAEVDVHLFGVPVPSGDPVQGQAATYGAASFFRDFDLTAIVRVVLGLLALLLTFDAVIGEKERGTLKLVLANSLSPATMLGGKLLGSFVSLLLVMGSSFAVAVSIVAYRTDFGFWQELPRLAGLFLSYLLYLGAMLLIGALISLLAPSTSSSLVTSVSAWLVVVFLLPMVAQIPAGDLLSLERERRQVEEQVAALAAEMDGLLARKWREDPLRAVTSGHSSTFLQTSWNYAVLRRYGSARYYDSLVDYYRYQIALGREYADKVFAVRQRHQEELRDAERLTWLLSLPSPAFLLDRLSAVFAGTSLEDHDRFIDASRQYRLQLIDYLEARGAFDSWRWFTDDPQETHPWPAFFGMTPDEVEQGRVKELFSRFQEPAIAEALSRDQARFERDPARRLQLQDLPRFRQRSSLGETFQAVLPEATILLGINLLLAWFTLSRFGRFPLD